MRWDARKILNARKQRSDRFGWGYGDHENGTKVRCRQYRADFGINVDRVDACRGIHMLPRGNPTIYSNLYRELSSHSRTRVRNEGRIALAKTASDVGQLISSLGERHQSCQVNREVGFR